MIYRFQFGFLLFLIGVLLLVSFVSDSTARRNLRRWRTKNCIFCHLDPAGGGPRNAVGQVYEDNYFEFPEDFDPEAIMEEAEEVRQRLTTAVNIRTAYIKTTHVNLEGRARATCTSCHSSVDSFLLMQGELTVNAQASDKLRLTLSNNMGATLNMFATVDAVPKHLYVKVGQSAFHLVLSREITISWYVRGITSDHISGMSALKSGRVRQVVLQCCRGQWKSECWTGRR